MMTQCTLCNGQLELIHGDVRDPLTAEPFVISRCTTCKLGHTDPQPADLTRYYQPVYYGNRHGFSLRHCLNRRLRFVEQVTVRRSDRTLLDIGCGDGSFLIACARKGWIVTGTELNPQTARAKGLAVLESIDDLPPESHFDCITMWHTLEHMSDPVGMLKHLRERLQPDGRLIVAVPDFGGFQARIFRSHWLHLDVPRHLYHFDSTSLAYCLTAAGFVIDRRWHQEFEYDLLGWVQSTLNWLLPKPNLFFDWLTGKRTAAGSLLIPLAVALGGVVSILLLPALLAGTLAKRGGTLIVAARPCHDQ